MHRTTEKHSLVRAPIPESSLARRDPVLAKLIAKQPEQWSSCEPHDPIWGLIKLIAAQQVSTSMALQVAERLHTRLGPMPDRILRANAIFDIEELRACGLTARRAACCAEVAARAVEIRNAITEPGWPELLRGIKGIGPWTLAMFQIAVLRHEDILPERDVGLIRAVRVAYGPDAQIEALAESWRPYRSVACWYLWRSLGNAPLV